MTPTDRTMKLCPSMSGGNNWWSASYSPKTKLLYIPSAAYCNEVELDPDSCKRGNKRGAAFKQIERNESDIVVADPFTGDIKHKIHAAYPNNSAALTTGGGLVFTGYGCRIVRRRGR